MGVFGVDANSVLATGCSGNAEIRTQPPGKINPVSYQSTLRWSAAMDSHRKNDWRRL